MTQLAILSAGMVTAVGFNATTSCAAIRAGISGLEETYLTEYVGSMDYLRGAKVALPQWWNNLYKLADLVAPAIWQCLQLIPKDQHHEIPILLGVSLPETQFLGDCQKENLLGIIEEKLGLPHHSYSQIIALGQTSGVYALKLAQAILVNNKASLCIIAGTDSYLQRETVDYYIESRRIITQQNSNGFFPGEAGAASLVSLSTTQPKAKLHIIGLGEGNEPAIITAEDPPFKATGMTNALKNLINNTDVNLEQVKCSLSDLNGEYYKFNEITIALSRFNRRDHSVAMDEIWHPIEYIGEVGAAIVPILLNIALYAGLKNYAPCQHLLFHVGNDKHERAAFITRYH